MLRSTNVIVSPQCAEACRRLGRIFQVETNVSTSEYVSNVLHEVEALQRKTRDLTDELKV